jgi:ATP-binding cassette subfamily B protein
MRMLKEGMRVQGKTYAVAIVAMIVSAAMAGAVAWVMEKIVNVLSMPEQTGQVVNVAALVIVIFIARGLAGYVQSVSLAHAGNRIVAMQQSKAFAKLMRQGLSYFNVNETPDIILYVVQGSQSCRALVDIVVTTFVRDTLTLIALVAVMVYQQPVLSISALIAGPIVFAIVRFVLRRVQAVMENQFAAMAEIYRVLQEGAAGIQIIKVFALEGKMRGRMDQAVRSVEKRANSIVRLEAATAPMMETLAGLIISGVIIVSALNPFGEPTTAGQLMSFITALLMAYEPAKRLSRARVSIEAALVGVRMLFNLLDRPDTQIDAPDAVPMQSGPGRIVFEDVGFSYAAEPVLNGLNAVFPEGKMSALVGPSGGGKSTMLSLAMRLNDPRHGRIMIDGQDLSRVSFASLQARISYVGQSTFLFSASVRDNIRVSRPEASDDEVLEAARLANAHEFIVKLPMGYETPVGENGGHLSGGQRQRLAIARAFLKRPEIIFLDEATSALDSHSENLIQDSLKRITAGRTSIVIAHRLTTILAADRIFFVDGGQVMEEGTVAELLARESRFRALYYEQFGALSGFDNGTISLGRAMPED